MSESDGKNRAALVLGELLAELTRRRHVRDLLDRSLSDDGREDLVRKLADGIEEHLAAIAPPAVVAKPAPPVKESPAPVFSVPKIPLPISDTPAPPVFSRPEGPKTPPVPHSPSSAPIVAKDRINLGVPERTQASEEQKVPSRHFVLSKQVFEVPAEGAFYIHGVAGVPHDDQPSAKPFLLEEKGIDGERLAFGWDLGTIRFYLSLMRDEIAALGRGGVLLLPKQDSVRLRGVHESIVNDLRLHGNVLPFSFGTVVKGWEEAQRKLSAAAPRARQALEKLEKTKRWTLTVSAQDNRFADLQQNPTLEKRRELDRHRSSFTAAAGMGRHLDVRELERVLNKQRRVAEGIHRELSEVADKTEVQSIVSLQSGSSEGWKQILRATYDISPTMVSRFHRMVTDIQYEHLLLELMIALTGEMPSISLVEPA